MPASPRTSLAGLAGLLGLALSLGACADVTSPTPLTPGTPRLSGGSGSGSDSSTSSGGGSGGGSTSGSDYAACGTLSANIQAYNIVVYTTRTGIGFSGTATNCGTRKEAFEVDVVDTDADPACTVDVPHFIAPKNTDPGMTITWQANSTLVPCQGKTHYFDLRLWDTRTGQTLATTTASAFL